MPAVEDFTQTWRSWRRGLDYYDEDVLNWLWVEMLLRQLSVGKKSMDDFCHAFQEAQAVAQR